MQELFQYIKELSKLFRLPFQQQIIEHIEEFAINKYINIAILGQFKAGKSSFINSFIGKDVLPTAVIPATSVITIIRYGKQEKVEIVYLDNEKEEISINQLGEFVTESKNPNNCKKVKRAIINLPELKQFEKINFIDTPGIGGLFSNNTETTENWLPEATIALVCISAERPLSEQDIALFNELKQYSFKTHCLITKTDLFTTSQLNEISQFLYQSLKNLYNYEIPIFPYSIKLNTANYNKKIIDEILEPLINTHDKLFEEIYKHKVSTLLNKTIDFFEILYQASLRNDVEKNELKLKILDERANLSFIRHEIQLIAVDKKSHIRKEINSFLKRYEDDLINEIELLFDKESKKWRGNLFKITDRYKNWLKETLTSKLTEIQKKEQQNFEKIIIQVNSQFSFFSKSFKERLSENIYNLLGIKCSSDEWTPEYNPLKRADVSIYSIFDIHIELLWFLFPMFIFKPMFYKKFKNQIKVEVSKNIERLTSYISEIINKQIDDSKEQTIRYLMNEIEAIDAAFSNTKNSKDEIATILNTLKSF